MQHQRGMTLLEILIASAIFVTMAAMVLSAMISYRGLSTAVEDGDILAEQATNAQRLIARNFINAGWFYCLPGASSDGKRYPQIHIANQLSWQQLNIVPAPQVDIPLFDPLTQKTTVTHFTASVTTNLSTPLGDALVFPLLQPEGTTSTDTPVDVISPSIVNFQTQPPVRLSDFPNARAINSLVIDPSQSDATKITSVVWQTTPATIAGMIGVSDLYDDTKVRLYCYRVVRDPATGRGSLIRFYNNPNSGDRNSLSSWIQDVVIATDVVSMNVYSYAMSTWYAGTSGARDFSSNPGAGLANNQLRFIILFARNVSPKDPTKPMDPTTMTNTVITNPSRAVITKRLEFTVGLRSITNAIDQ